VGNTSDIRITFRDEINIDSSSFIINKTRPFHFVISRFLLLFVLGSVIVIIRSGILSFAVDLSDKTQLLTLFIVSVIFAALWGKITCDSYFPEYAFLYYDKVHYVEHIYNYLSQSLLNGHTYMNFDPPAYLKEMADPYLENERFKMAALYGEDSLLDYAYYNGHYYCYYGIIPALIFYLPYVALTGLPVHGCYVIAICGFIFIPASFALIYRLVKRFRGDMPFDSYILLSLLFMHCSGFLTLVKLPTIYGIPMAVSYILLVLGLYFWLTSVKDEKISVKYLILGAVMIAMTLGCRPVFFIALFLAFPIFWDRIRKGEFFRTDKTSIRNTLAVIIPFLVIDSLLLVYNYVRFDSLFEFGARYNFSRDLYDDRFILARIPYGLFTYFVQPLNVNTRFPYVHAINDNKVMPTDYQGFTYSESFTGGLFAIVPFCLAVFLIPFVIRHMKENRSRFIVFTLIAMSVILSVVDLEFGGISNRYIVDFSIFLLLAAIIVVLSVKSDDPGRLRRIFIIAAVCSIIFSYFLLLSDGRNYCMRDYMPDEFNYFRYLVFDLR